MCEPLTRRQVLRYAALAMATPVIASGPWRPAKAFAQVESQAVPMNLELVTVSDTRMIATWFTGNPLDVDEFGRPRPIPSNTRLDLGPVLGELSTVVDRDDETPYHYVEVEGLAPGQQYAYRALSNGLIATPTAVPPSLAGGTSVDTAASGVFTTLVPPAGALLFTMCWANDVHIGEMTSGLAISNDRLPGGGFPPGFAADPDDPYPTFMARAAVAEARARGAELMLVNGDLTSEAEPVFMDTAKGIFDQFGTHEQDYFVTRGNHDRAHSGDTWAGCQPLESNPEYNDCLRDYFFPDGETYFSFDRSGVHFVGLDTNDILTGEGRMTDRQLEWLEEDLVSARDRPTFIFGHHPVSEESSLTAVPPIVFTLEAEAARRVERSAAEHSVVGVYSGHTHRNKVTSATNAPGVPFIEVGAVKEYPGGYSLVQVYEGGYMVNFYKAQADQSKAWSERSRGQYLGLYPYYTLGTLDERNFVVAADFSDAARNPPATREPAPSPSPREAPSASEGVLPATGGSSAGLVGAALAAGTAALATRHLAGRDPDQRPTA